MNIICKECSIEKDISCYYKHPEGRHGVLSRCKECIKAGRKTEREKEMARKRDRRRYNLNLSGRKYYVYKKSKQFRIDNPEKAKAHKKVSNFMRNNRDLRPNKCCCCGKKCKVDFHHEEYSKINEVYPLCRLCHNNRHVGNIELKKEWLIILPF